MTVNKKMCRPNLSDIAYQEIKEMIFAGELVQGKRILLDRMSTLLNLSVTPVREALNKLAQENLVQMTPRTSYEVVNLDRNNISDILDLRELLETFALRSMGEEVANFPIQRFRDLLQKRYTLKGYRKFIAADFSFHQEIVAFSKNKMLPILFEPIYNYIRVLSVPSAKVKGRIEEVRKEHGQILDAMEAGDMELAEQKMSAHLRVVKKILLEDFEARENNPGA